MPTVLFRNLRPFLSDLDRSLLSGFELLQIHKLSSAIRVDTCNRGVNILKNDNNNNDIKSKSGKLSDNCIKRLRFYQVFSIWLQISEP